MPTNLEKYQKKIDDIDLRILFELDKDSRRSVNELSKVTGFNKDTIAYRITQLEKKGSIKGYYTIIDWSKLGYQFLIRIYIRFQNTTLPVEDEIFQYVLQQPKTFTIFKTEGDWDMAIGYFGKSLYDFDEYYHQFLERYRRYIYTQRISIFKEYIQFCRNYLIKYSPRDFTTIITGNSFEVKTDNIDKSILQKISENAKKPLLELSNELDLTPTGIKYRIREMEKKNIILGYKALIDLSKIGYEYYKVDLEIEDMTRLKDLSNFVLYHPNIVYEDRTIGGSDFEFDCELKCQDELYSLIEEFKKKFPGLIRTFKYYKAKKIYKFSFCPFT